MSAEQAGQKEALLTEDERKEAFAAPPSRISHRTIAIIALACVALGGGGVVADHFFGGPTTSPSAGVTSGSTPPPLPGTGSSGTAGAGTARPMPGVPAATAALMSLTPGTSHAAPGFRLFDQTGSRLSLASLRGRVVVLSFFDSTCDDICPVVEHELAGARAALAAKGVGSRVAFVTVNTDPLATSRASARGALAGPLRSSTSSTAGGWYFLTAPLPALNAVWRSYGITVEVQRASGTVSHTDAIDFVTPAGDLAARATPFADQVGRGRYELAPNEISHFGTGIADEVEQLLRHGGSQA